MDIRPPTVRSSSIVLSCGLTLALGRGVPGSGGLSHSKGDPHGDGEPTRRAASSLFAETTTDPWERASVTTATMGDVHHHSGFGSVGARATGSASPRFRYDRPRSRCVRISKLN